MYPVDDEGNHAFAYIFSKKILINRTFDERTC